MASAKGKSKIISNEERKNYLSGFLPEKSVDTIIEWVDKYAVNLKITNSRRSKLGDYRSPFAGEGHRITINHDLNKYSFLITLVHEFAHLTTFEKYRRKRINPHGKEWKNEFQVLLDPFLTHDFFPADVLTALNKYIIDPAASSCTDTHLLRILAGYDKNQPEESGIVHVEDIPIDTIFLLENGMIFKKGELLRKRFRCTEMKSKRTYFVSPLAKARLIEPVAPVKTAILDLTKNEPETKTSLNSPQNKEIKKEQKQLSLF